MKYVYSFDIKGMRSKYDNQVVTACTKTGNGLPKCESVLAREDIQILLLLTLQIPLNYPFLIRDIWLIVTQLIFFVRRC